MKVSSRESVEALLTMCATAACGSCTPCCGDVQADRIVMWNNFAMIPNATHAVRGGGLSEGKLRDNVCEVRGGARVPLVPYCENLQDEWAFTRVGCNMIPTVMRVELDGVHSEGCLRGSACNACRRVDRSFLLLLFENLDGIWAALPLISKANHFELTDFP